VFVSCPLVYCDTTASRRKAHVLTIKSSRVGVAVDVRERLYEVVEIDIGEFHPSPLEKSMR
jgi:hypothetical protein